MGSKGDGKTDHGPIVVGGVGGSGTRVVAEILLSLGFFLGWDLNVERDNLFYTLLFKRPAWFYRNRHNEPEITAGLRLFRRLMMGEGLPSTAEWSFLLRAVVSMALRGHNHRGDGRGMWPFQRLGRLLARSDPTGRTAAGWGWKEPNSFLLLRQMAATLEGFRYVHVIRHGLDVAFSKNQQQLYNWGPLFGVARPTDPAAEPSASLRYWIRANEQALQEGKQLGDEGFLVVNFEELCLDTEAAVLRMVSFLGIEPTDEACQRAGALVGKPASIGRYRAHDLSQFERVDLLSLHKLGCTIE